jgi:hypothetical protein
MVMRDLVYDLNPDFFWAWVASLRELDGALGMEEDMFFYVFCGASRLSP